jgi:hypothetical protein
VSASSFTDWSIECDYPDCGKQVWASQTMLRDATAASLRKELKRSGWTVDISTLGDIHQKRHLDFCPDHKPGKEAVR